MVRDSCRLWRISAMEGKARIVGVGRSPGPGVTASLALIGFQLGRAFREVAYGSKGILLIQGRSRLSQLGVVKGK